MSYAATLGPECADKVEQRFRELEVEAIPTATTTPGVGDAIRALKRAGHTITIVSNNSETAVTAYVTARGLDDHIDGITARITSDPAELKPSPELLRRAVNALGVEPPKCVLIGDSVTDVQAARAAGTAANRIRQQAWKHARLLAQKRTP